MTRFSKTWKGSSQPRKQRKYRAYAPLHIKRKFLNAHLTKELAKKHGRRSIIVRKGDKAKVLRGAFKGKEGKIERVDIKKTRIYVSGIEVSKREGAKVFPPLDPSSIIITELVMEDKKRLEKTQSGVKK